METHLLNILSVDQNLRNEATEYFNRLCKESPDATAQNLLKLIVSSNDPKILDLSSLILHKNILSKEEIKDVSDQTLQLTFQSLLDLVFSKSSLSNSLVYRIAEIVIKIGVDKRIHIKIIEILKEKMQLQNPSQQQILFVLYCLQLLCEFTFDVNILEQINQEIGLFVKSQMQNPTTEIKSQAALVLVGIMTNIKNPLFLSSFEGAFNDMLDLIIGIIQTNNEEQSIKMISAL